MSTMTTVHIEAALQWRARPTAGGSRWMAECDAVDLAMEASSLDELHSVIAEALHLMFLDLLEDDELDQFLRDKGWKAAGLPGRSHTDNVEFDVPFELIAQGASKRDSARKAH
jgi:hypothetical protein